MTTASFLVRARNYNQGGAKSHGSTDPLSIKCNSLKTFLYLTQIGQGKNRSLKRSKVNDRKDSRLVIMIEFISDWLGNDFFVLKSIRGMTKMCSC